MKYLFKLIAHSWIKENIGTVVLVPTILGGIWQVIELSSIGAPFIRFFSVSQLASDGILLLFIFTFVYLTCSLFPKAIKGEDEHVSEVTPEENHESGSREIAFGGFFIRTAGISRYAKREGYWLAGTLLAIFIIIFSWAWWPDIMVPFLKMEKLTIMTIIGLITGPLIGWTILRVVLETIFEIHSLELNRNNKNVRDVMIIFYVILFGAFLYAFFPFLTLFHRSYLLPENFKNTSYIECKIKANNKDLKSFGIEYFNDKYIFVALIDNHNKRSIEVFKFEDFLDSSACDLK